MVSLPSGSTRTTSVNLAKVEPLNERKYLFQAACQTERIGGLVGGLATAPGPGFV